MMIDTVRCGDMGGAADRTGGQASRMGYLALSALALALLATPAAAQFPHPPAEKIKAAPVVPARSPDGHPNWTGFWVTPNGFLETYRGPSGVTNQPANLNTPMVRTDIPLKPEYRAKYEAAIKQAAAGTLGNRVAACFPPGMPAMMGAIYGIEILQTPNIISITSEWQAETRRIWMDLKKHPPLEELDPTYAGHSIGHWEKDTLVVDTVGLRPDVALDAGYLPHSDKTRIVERFHQAAPGVLVDDMTIFDPDVFTKPWVRQNVYVHKPEFRLEEYNCLENNRNVDAEGRTKFDK